MPHFLNVLDLLSAKNWKSHHKDRGRISNLNRIAKQLFKAHYHDQHNKAVSHHFAIALKRHIRSTFKTRRRTQPFVEEIRRTLLFLHEYNLRVAKVKLSNKYPMSRHFNNLLVQYIELECEALYSKKDPVSRQDERDVAQRVLRLLHVILYDAIHCSEVDPDLETATKTCFKIMLKLVTGVRADCNCENRVVADLIMLLIDKIDINAEINKLKGRNIPFYLDTRLIDPDVLKVRQNLAITGFESDGSDSDVEESVLSNQVNPLGFLNQREPAIGHKAKQELNCDKMPCTKSTIQSKILGFPALGESESKSFFRQSNTTDNINDENILAVIDLSDDDDVFISQGADAEPFPHKPMQLLSQEEIKTEKNDDARVPDYSNENSNGNSDNYSETSNNNNNNNGTQDLDGPMSKDSSTYFEGFRRNCLNSKLLESSIQKDAPKNGDSSTVVAPEVVHFPMGTSGAEKLQEIQIVTEADVVEISESPRTKKMQKEKVFQNIQSEKESSQNINDEESNAVQKVQNAEPTTSPASVTETRKDLTEQVTEEIVDISVDEDALLSSEPEDLDDVPRDSYVDLTDTREEAEQRLRNPEKSSQVVSTLDLTVEPPTHHLIQQTIDSTDKTTVTQESVENTLHIESSEEVETSNKCDDQIFQKQAADALDDESAVVQCINEENQSAVLGTDEFQQIQSEACIAATRKEPLSFSFEEQICCEVLDELIDEIVTSESFSAAYCSADNSSAKVTEKPEVELHWGQIFDEQMINQLAEGRLQTERVDSVREAIPSAVPIQDDAATEELPKQLAVEESPVAESTVEHLVVEESKIEELAAEAAPAEQHYHTFTTEEPLIESVAVEEPSVEQHLIQRSSEPNVEHVEQLAIEEHLLERSTSEELPAEEHVEQLSVENYAGEQFSIQQHIVEQPIVERLTVEDSIVAQSNVEDLESTIDGHRVEESTVKDYIEPIAEKYLFVESTLERSTTEELPAEEYAEQLSIQEHTLERLNIEEPIVEQLTVEDPIVAQSTVEDHIIVESAIEEHVIIEELTVGDHDEQLAVEERVKQLAVEDLTVEHVPVENPIIAQQIVEEHAIVEHTIDEPTIEKTTVEEPLSLEAMTDTSFVEKTTIEEATCEVVMVEEAVVEKATVEEATVGKAAVVETAIDEAIVEDLSVKRVGSNIVTRQGRKRYASTRNSTGVNDEVIATEQVNKESLQSRNSRSTDRLASAVVEDQILESRTEELEVVGANDPNFEHEFAIGHEKRTTDEVVGCKNLTPERMPVNVESTELKADEEKPASETETTILNLIEAECKKLHINASPRAGDSVVDGIAAEAFAADNALSTEEMPVGKDFEEAEFPLKEQPKEYPILVEPPPADQVIFDVDPAELDKKDNALLTLADAAAMRKNLDVASNLESNLKKELLGTPRRRRRHGDCPTKTLPHRNARDNNRYLSWTRQGKRMMQATSPRNTKNSIKKTEPHDFTALKTIISPRANNVYNQKPMMETETPSDDSNDSCDSSSMCIDEGVLHQSRTFDRDIGEEEPCELQPAPGDACISIPEHVGVSCNSSAKFLEELEEFTDSHPINKFACDYANVKNDRIYQVETNDDGHVEPGLGPFGKTDHSIETILNKVPPLGRDTISLTIEAVVRGETAEPAGDRGEQGNKQFKSKAARKYYSERVPYVLMTRMGKDENAEINGDIDFHDDVAAETEILHEVVVNSCEESREPLDLSLLSGNKHYETHTQNVDSSRTTLRKSTRIKLRHEHGLKPEVSEVVGEEISVPDTNSSEDFLDSGKNMDEVSKSEEICSTSENVKSQKRTRSSGKPKKIGLEQTINILKERLEKPKEVMVDTESLLKPSEDASGTDTKSRTRSKSEPFEKKTKSICSEECEAVATDTRSRRRRKIELVEVISSKYNWSEDSEASGSDSKNKRRRGASNELSVKDDRAQPNKLLETQIEIGGKSKVRSKSVEEKTDSKRSGIEMTELKENNTDGTKKKQTRRRCSTSCKLDDVSFKPVSVECSSRSTDRIMTRRCSRSSVVDTLEKNDDDVDLETRSKSKGNDAINCDVEEDEDDVDLKTRIESRLSDGKSAGMERTTNAIDVAKIVEKQKSKKNKKLKEESLDKIENCEKSIIIEPSKMDEEKDIKTICKSKSDVNKNSGVEETNAVETITTTTTKNDGNIKQAEKQQPKKHRKPKVESADKTEQNEKSNTESLKKNEEKAKSMSIKNTKKVVEIVAKEKEILAKTTERPAETTEKPAKTTEKPAKSTEKPAKTTEKPAKTTEKPAKTTEKPAKITEKPAKSTEKHSKIIEKHTKNTEKPANATEKAKTTEKLAKTTEKPVKTTEKPAKTTEKSAKTTEKPAKTTEKPAKTMEKPMCNKEKDSKDKSKSLKNEEKIVEVASEENSVTGRGKSPRRPNLRELYGFKHRTSDEYQEVTVDAPQKVGNIDKAKLNVEPFNMLQPDSVKERKLEVEVIKERASSEHSKKSKNNKIETNDKKRRRSLSPSNSKQSVKKQRRSDSENDRSRSLDQSHRQEDKERRNRDQSEPNGRKKSKSSERRNESKSKGASSERNISEKSERKAEVTEDRHSPSSKSSERKSESKSKESKRNSRSTSSESLSEANRKAEAVEGRRSTRSPSKSAERRSGSKSNDSKRTSSDRSSEKREVESKHGISSRSKDRSRSTEKKPILDDRQRDSKDKHKSVAIVTIKNNTADKKKINSLHKHEDNKYGSRVSHKNSEKKGSAARSKVVVLEEARGNCRSPTIAEIKASLRNTEIPVEEQPETRTTEASPEIITEEKVRTGTQLEAHAETGTEKISTKHIHDLSRTEANPDECPGVRGINEATTSEGADLLQSPQHIEEAVIESVEDFVMADDHTTEPPPPTSQDIVEHVEEAVTEPVEDFVMADDCVIETEPPTTTLPDAVECDEEPRLKPEDTNQVEPVRTAAPAELCNFDETTSKPVSVDATHKDTDQSSEETQQDLMAEDLEQVEKIEEQPSDEAQLSVAEDLEQVEKVVEEQPSEETLPFVADDIEYDHKVLKERPMTEDLEQVEKVEEQPSDEAQLSVAEDLEQVEKVVEEQPSEETQLLVTDIEHTVEERQVEERQHLIVEDMEHDHKILEEQSGEKTQNLVTEDIEHMHDEKTVEARPSEEKEHLIAEEVEYQHKIIEEQPSEQMQPLVSEDIEHRHDEKTVEERLSEKPQHLIPEGIEYQHKILEEQPSEEAQQTIAEDIEYRHDAKTVEARPSEEKQHLVAEEVEYQHKIIEEQPSEQMQPLVSEDIEHRHDEKTVEERLSEKPQHLIPEGIEYQHKILEEQPSEEAQQTIAEDIEYRHDAKTVEARPSEEKQHLIAKEVEYQHKIIEEQPSEQMLPLVSEDIEHRHDEKTVEERLSEKPHHLIPEGIEYQHKILEEQPSEEAQQTIAEDIEYRHDAKTVEARPSKEKQHLVTEDMGHLDAKTVKEGPSEDTQFLIADDIEDHHDILEEQQREKIQHLVAHDIKHRDDEKTVEERPSEKTEHISENIEDQHNILEEQSSEETHHLIAEDFEHKDDEKTVEERPRAETHHLIDIELDHKILEERSNEKMQYLVTEDNKHGHGQKTVEEFPPTLMSQIPTVVNQNGPIEYDVSKDSVKPGRNTPENTEMPYLTPEFPSNNLEQCSENAEEIQSFAGEREKDDFLAGAETVETNREAIVEDAKILYRSGEISEDGQRSAETELEKSENATKTGQVEEHVEAEPINAVQDEEKITKQSDVAQSERKVEDANEERHIAVENVPGSVPEHKADILQELVTEFGIVTPAFSVHDSKRNEEEPLNSEQTEAVVEKLPATTSTCVPHEVPLPKQQAEESLVREKRSVHVEIPEVVVRNEMEKLRLDEPVPCINEGVASLLYKRRYSNVSEPEPLEPEEHEKRKRDIEDVSEIRPKRNKETGERYEIGSNFSDEETIMSLPDEVLSSAAKQKPNLYDSPHTLSEIFANHIDSSNAAKYLSPAQVEVEVECGFVELGDKSSSSETFEPDPKLLDISSGVETAFKVISTYSEPSSRTFRVKESTNKSFVVPEPDDNLICSPKTIALSKVLHNAVAPFSGQSSGGSLPETPNLLCALRLQDISPSKLRMGSNEGFDSIPYSIPYDDVIDDACSKLDSPNLDGSGDHTYTSNMGGPLLSGQGVAREEREMLCRDEAPLPPNTPVDPMMLPQVDIMDDDLGFSDTSNLIEVDHLTIEYYDLKCKKEKPDLETTIPLVIPGPAPDVILDIHNKYAEEELYKLRQTNPPPDLGLPEQIIETEEHPCVTNSFSPVVPENIIETSQESDCSVANYMMMSNNYSSFIPHQKVLVENIEQCLYPNVKKDHITPPKQIQDVPVVPRKIPKSVKKPDDSNILDLQKLTQRKNFKTAVRPGPRRTPTQQSPLKIPVVKSPEMLTFDLKPKSPNRKSQRDMNDILPVSDFGSPEGKIRVKTNADLMMPTATPVTGSENSLPKLSPQAFPEEERKLPVVPKDKSEPRRTRYDAYGKDYIMEELLNKATKQSQEKKSDEKKVDAKKIPEANNKRKSNTPPNNDDNNKRTKKEDLPESLFDKLRKEGSVNPHFTEEKKYPSAKDMGRIRETHGVHNQLKDMPPMPATKDKPYSQNVPNSRHHEGNHHMDRRRGGYREREHHPRSNSYGSSQRPTRGPPSPVDYHRRSQRIMPDLKALKSNHHTSVYAPTRRTSSIMRGGAAAADGSKSVRHAENASKSQGLDLWEKFEVNLGMVNKSPGQPLFGTPGSSSTAP